MIIHRDYYLQQFINAKQNGMIKVITGVRRSGKSFLLFELFDMARQTSWQILCYLEVLAYTLKNVSGLPLLPLIVFDNISMPYDINVGKNNYKSIYSFIKQFAQEKGIQIILTSNIKVQDVGDVEQIDISDGLNPVYNT